MRHVTLAILLCGLLSACSFWQEQISDEVVIAATPAPPPAPDTSFCQRIARQDAAVHFTALTQRGIYDRSYAQCAAMFY